METVREWAECLKSDRCDYIRITDFETGDLYFAWDYSDAETEFRDIMDREVKDSLSSYYDVDDDGNGLWPGYELEI